ncbi:MAG: hypothetical protein HC905_16305 [Bacteroidales bacterium]|nr:hypothetical protein [Bacteroidales bacterium]
MIIKKPEFIGHKIPPFNRIYFLNGDGIYYYFFSNEKNNPYSFVVIENNNIIKPYSSFDTPNFIDRDFENDDDLIKYCKSLINKYNKYEFNLKDRFSFIMFNGNERIYLNPSKTNDELIYSSISCLEYENI